MARKFSLSKVLGFALVGGIVAALVIMSALTVYGGLRETVRILRGEWKTTDGQVLSSFVSTRRRFRVQVVEYEYRVGSEAYRGHHQSDPSKKYAPGQPIRIYYDKPRPALSYAEEHPRTGLPEAVVLIVVGLVLFVPSGAVGLFVLWPSAAIRLLVLLTGWFNLERWAGRRLGEQP